MKSLKIGNECYLSTVETRVKLLYICIDSCGFEVLKAVFTGFGIGLSLELNIDKGDD